jgi:hypothetical protein
MKGKGTGKTEKKIVANQTPQLVRLRRLRLNSTESQRGAT